MQNYFDQWESPWMQLYYRMVWSQLAAEISLTGKKILDFGSGFGWNANHFSDRSFDLILCHNVFEYAVDERLEMMREFDRLIKKEGVISIVKHNHAGALMQKIVFENAL